MKENLEQPRMAIGPLLEPVKRLPGLQVDFLGDIFGTSIVAHHTEGGPKDAIQMGHCLGFEPVGRGLMSAQVVCRRWDGHTEGDLCDFGLWVLAVRKSETRRFSLEMPSRRRFIPQSWKILHGVDLKGLDDAEAVAMTMRAPSECSSRFY